MEVSSNSVQEECSLLLKKMQEQKPLRFRQVRVPKRKLQAALELSLNSTASNSTEVCYSNSSEVLGLSTEERFSNLVSSILSTTEESLMCINQPMNELHKEMSSDDTLCSEQTSTKNFINATELCGLTSEGLPDITHQFMDIYPREPGSDDIEPRFCELLARYSIPTMETIKLDSSDSSALVNLTVSNISKEELYKVDSRTALNSHFECEKNETNKEFRKDDCLGDLQSQGKPYPFESAIEENMLASKMDRRDQMQLGADTDGEFYGQDKDPDIPLPDPVSSDEAYNSDTSGILNVTFDSLKKKIKLSNEVLQPEAVTKQQLSAGDELAQVSQRCSKDIQSKESQNKMDKLMDAKLGTKEFQSMRAKIWSEQISALSRQKQESNKDTTFQKTKHRTTATKGHGDHRKRERVTDIVAQKNVKRRRLSLQGTLSVDKNKDVEVVNRSKRTSEKAHGLQKEQVRQKSVAKNERALGKMKSFKKSLHESHLNHIQKEKDLGRSTRGKEIARKKKVLKLSCQKTHLVKDSNKTFKENLKDERVSTHKKKDHGSDHVLLLSSYKTRGHQSDDDFCDKNRKNSFASLGKAQQIKALKQRKSTKGSKLNDTVLATKNLGTLSSLDKTAKVVLDVEPILPERVGVLLESANQAHAGGIWKNIVFE